MIGCALWGSAFPVDPGTYVIAAKVPGKKSWSQTVQVVTYTAAQGWVQRGADIPVVFAAGDQFGARAKADGTVEVYRNGTLLGSRSVSAWPYAGSSGSIGLWLINAAGTLPDDFGGG